MLGQYFPSTYYVWNIKIPGTCRRLWSLHLLKYQYNTNSWLLPLPGGEKKNVFLNIPGRSVISSSSQVTSESYEGASKGFNHIAQQMLWNYYSESLPRTSTAPWFSWNNLWPTLSLHQLHYDCINPKDALTSPLLQFLWIPTPHMYLTSHHHIHALCSFICCLKQDYFQKCISTKTTSLIYTELLPNSLVLVFSAFVSP